MGMTILPKPGNRRRAQVPAVQIMVPVRTVFRAATRSKSLRRWEIDRILIRARTRVFRRRVVPVKFTIYPVG